MASVIDKLPESVTRRDVYIPQGDGSATLVTLLGGVVVSVEWDAAVMAPHYPEGETSHG